jgi:hypothetical protein
MRSAVVVVILAAVLAVLWVLPPLVFPHPGTNDAIDLSSLEPPVLLVGLVGLVIAIVRSRGAQHVRISAGLGVFFIGVAADFVVGLAAFGNTSNDRFAAIVFGPFAFGGAALGVLISGLLTRGTDRPSRSDLLRGAGYGLAAASAVAAWVLVRGSRDWLLAPYGFDVLLAILVLGAAVAWLSGEGVRAPASHG